MNRIFRTLFAMCGLLLMGACASAPAAIGEDANYIIEVTNPSAHAMAVTADLGAGTNAVLGELRPGETKRFEIRNPGTNDIVITGSNADKTHIVREDVELERGVIARVILD